MPKSTFILKLLLSAVVFPAAMLLACFVLNYLDIYLFTNVMPRYGVPVFIAPERIMIFALASGFASCILFPVFTLISKKDTLDALSPTGMFFLLLFAGRTGWQSAAVKRRASAIATFMLFALSLYWRFLIPLLLIFILLPIPSLIRATDKKPGFAMIPYSLVLDLILVLLFLFPSPDFQQSICMRNTRDMIEKARSMKAEGPLTVDEKLVFCIPGKTPLKVVAPSAGNGGLLIYDSLASPHKGGTTAAFDDGICIMIYGPGLFGRFENTGELYTTAFFARIFF